MARTTGPDVEQQGGVLRRLAMGSKLGGRDFHGLSRQHELVATPAMGLTRVAVRGNAVGGPQVGQT